MIRIAVYGLRDERDLAAFLASGADGAVFGSGVSGADVILPSTAKRLSEALPPCLTPMFLASPQDGEAVAEAAGSSELRTVLFAGLSPEDTAGLRRKFPAHKLLRIFSGAELLEYGGKEYAPFLNGCVLDGSGAEEWPQPGIREWMMHSPLPVFFMGKGESLRAIAAEFRPFGALLPCPRLPGGVPDETALRESVRLLKEV